MPRMTTPKPPVPSPCINVCRMNEATGLCEGCQRTLDEIAFWSVMDEGDKGAVWAELALRRAMLQQRGLQGPVADAA